LRTDPAATVQPGSQHLRDLQRVSTLDKVRKRLGVSRASLGSLSESVAIFDPEPLKAIAAELGHRISSRQGGSLPDVGQRITAVDGTVVETVRPPGSSGSADPGAGQSA
jgi:hypothetical protein